MEFEPNIVRVGGRTRSEKMEGKKLLDVSRNNLDEKEAAKQRKLYGKTRAQVKLHQRIL